MPAMKWLFVCRRDLVVCYVFVCIFLHTFISFKYDFHVDAETMIGVDGLLNNGTIPFVGMN